MIDYLNAYVANKFAAAEFACDPFKHLIIDNIFPQDVFDSITQNKITSDQLPSMKEVRYLPRGYSEARKAISIINNPEYIPIGTKPFWQSLGNWFVGDFTDLVISKFNITKPYTVNVLYTRDERGYQLGPHTDKPSKIMTLLFYIPSQPTNQKFGTTIFTPKQAGLTCKGHKHHSFNNFDVYSNIEYLPNRMFGFEKTNQSFHGVLPIDQDCERDLLIYNLDMVYK